MDNMSAALSQLNGFCSCLSSLSSDPRSFASFHRARTRGGLRLGFSPRKLALGGRRRFVPFAVDDSTEINRELGGGAVSSAVGNRPQGDLDLGSAIGGLQNPEQENEQNGLYDFLYPSKELLPDDTEMSLFDHLEELRQRIFVSVLAVGAAILGCFAFSKDLIRILEAPVQEQGVRFLQLAPGEFFFTTLKKASL